MKLAITSLAALLLTGTLLAQPGPREGGKFRGAQRLDALKQTLNLTDEQVESLKAVQTSLREALQPTHQEMRTKMRGLREAIRAETPDGTQISQLRSDIQALQEDVKAKRAEYRIQAQNVLTADQQATLAELQKALEMGRAAHEAVGMNLLDGPDGRGFGAGRRGGFGPRGFRGRGGFRRTPAPEAQ